MDANHIIYRQVQTEFINRVDEFMRELKELNPPKGKGYTFATQ